MKRRWEFLNSSNPHSPDASSIGNFRRSGGVGASYLVAKPAICFFDVFYLSFGDFEQYVFTCYRLSKKMKRSVPGLDRL